MTWCVEPTVTVGGIGVSAVVRTRLVARTGDRSLAAHGEKRPVLLLFQGSGAITGMDLDGRTYDRDAIEKRFPGALSALADRPQPDP